MKQYLVIKISASPLLKLLIKWFGMQLHFTRVWSETEQDALKRVNTKHEPLFSAAEQINSINTDGSGWVNLAHMLPPIHKKVLLREIHTKGSEWREIERDNYIYDVVTFDGKECVDEYGDEHPCTNMNTNYTYHWKLIR
jgi:hypothetical protein